MTALTSPPATLLPVARAADLDPRPPERRWLIDGLWGDQAVGIVGGEPKCCKSFLALDVAVAVASGAPCLRHFTVARTGRVLLFAAEDALGVVRCRLDGICAAAGVDLAALDLDVITAPTLRIDNLDDQARLADTIAALRPTLLILDPFVRLHRIDENVCSEVAPLLAYLRELQRRFSLAILVVHHARKGAGRVRAGQALRGSSEFHAWLDSAIYLRRTDDELTLTVEHRAEPSHGPIPVQLVADGPALALTAEEAPAASASAQPEPAQTPALRIEAALADLGDAVTLDHLRRTCRMRTQTLCDALADLVRAGRVVKSEAGYRLA
ncbi:MAG: AAA family ATPase [Deltaproteobacteria bacterium]|nr:MAG: AAA family ATPase [Deltaproteobacteria bacterium]TMQ05778.1 MAG: AAA family ATPase [Deltaproteobacteria bacterium]